MNQRSLLFLNLHARRGNVNPDQIRQQLEDLGLKIVAIFTEDLEALRSWLETHRQEIDLVIVGGGDGTLNRLVDILVAMTLPLGIIPLGTANDLARTLGIPSNINAACRIIATGKPYPIDLGWVNGKYFFNVASLGLSVKITEQLSQGMKRRWGIFSYALTALRVLKKMHSFPVEIRLPEESIRVKTVQISVGNGRYYGGGMAIAWDAAIDDQRLDLYSLEIEHWWQIFFVFPALRRGLPAHHKYTRLLNAQELEINTPQIHNINTDGEITSQTPARFRVIAQALTVFVPRETSKPKAQKLRRT